MNWNLFWGIYMLGFSMAILLIWYFIYYRKKNYDIKCSEKTMGKIIKYSAIKYNQISLPIVEYKVNGFNYKAVGPKFRGIIIKSFSNPFIQVDNKIESNITTKEDLPEILKINIKNNLIENIDFNPLINLFPINSLVEVYYNPTNPKCSYVYRLIKPSKWLISIVILSICFFIISIILFFGPKLIMH